MTSTKKKKKQDKMMAKRMTILTQQAAEEEEEDEEAEGATTEGKDDMEAKARRLLAGGMVGQTGGEDEAGGLPTGEEFGEDLAAFLGLGVQSPAGLALLDIVDDIYSCNKVKVCGMERVP